MMCDFACDAIFFFHNICGIDTLYSKSEVLQNIPEIHY